MMFEEVVQWVALLAVDTAFEILCVAAGLVERVLERVQLDKIS